MRKKESKISTEESEEEEQDEETKHPEKNERKRRYSRTERRDTMMEKQTTVNFPVKITTHRTNNLKPRG